MFGKKNPKKTLKSLNINVYTSSHLSREDFMHFYAVQLWGKHA